MSRDLPFPSPRAAPLLAVVAAFTALTGCATNPATGQSQLSFFSEAEEIALGAEVDREFLGNARRYDDEKLGAWVSEIGHRLAAVSERPDLPWSFHVTDEEAVNAFALPGGRIYVTRGLLAHLDTEAELAGVLGHEIGHVSARHSVNALSRQIAWTLGVATGLALLEAGETADTVTSLGLGLLFLQFDRGQERQADQLGVRYLQRVGLEPHGLVDALRVLQQVSRAQGEGWFPVWLSTHPDPERRGQRLAEEMALEPGPPATDAEIAAYLARIDGLVYGADPRNGTLRDRLYVQPRDGFQMSFPVGWEIEREGQTLAAANAAGDALLVVLPQTSQTVPDAVAAFGREEGIAVDRSWEETLGGLAARIVDFRIVEGEETVWAKGAFVQTPGKVVAIVAVAEFGAWPRHGDELQRAMRSIGRVSPANVPAEGPRRIRIVSLPHAMTAREIARRYSPGTDPAELALLNQVAIDEPLAAGRAVKIVQGHR